MQRHFAGAFLLAVTATVAAPAAQAQLLPVSIELGDVSLTKLPFVMAAEAASAHHRARNAFARLNLSPTALQPMNATPSQAPTEFTL